MKDILDVIKAGVIVISTFGVILTGVHFGIGTHYNPLHDVPQTHVYNGN